MKKRVLAILLSVVMLVGISPLALMAQYSDMPAESHWSYQALSTASELGLLQGSNGKILPNDKLTRAQMATILVRAFKATETSPVFNFSDVAQDAWFYKEMSIAFNQGWFKGSGDKIRPNDAISRQEVFVVLARAINAMPVSTYVLADNFTDAASVASWAQVEAGAMAAKGYIKGANGKMNPQSSITRAEFAQLMYNLIQGGEITVTAPQVPSVPEKEQSSSGGSGSPGTIGNTGKVEVEEEDNFVQDQWDTPAEDTGDAPSDDWDNDEDWSDIY